LALRVQIQAEYLPAPGRGAPRQQQQQKQQQQVVVASLVEGSDMADRIRAAMQPAAGA
jgi:hypothetical protein